MTNAVITFLGIVVFTRCVLLEIMVRRLSIRLRRIEECCPAGATFVLEPVEEEDEAESGAGEVVVSVEDKNQLNLSD